MASITILGGGPAGSSAALAALARGASVTVCERSILPRHKVCGEFLSPEIARELENLNAWSAFVGAGPARIRRMALHFGTRSKESLLPETAWGLSRYRFDHLLRQAAQDRGALLVPSLDRAPDVMATGRPGSKSPRGRRLFGFKAHFAGPANDAVELFFFDGIYVGISPIENGGTNVCGLGPENVLAKLGFDYDALVQRNPALRTRLAPLERQMPWLSVGPLEYRQSRNASAYLAGDALSFVDPFTGSGLFAAVKTGALAGTAAVEQVPHALHHSRCRATLKKPFLVASVLRRILDTGWADALAAFVPGRLLFTLTRPK